MVLHEPVDQADLLICGTSNTVSMSQEKVQKDSKIVGIHTNVAPKTVGNRGMGMTSLIIPEEMFS